MKVLSKMTISYWTGVKIMLTISRECSRMKDELWYRRSFGIHMQLQSYGGNFSICMSLLRHCRAIGICKPLLGRDRDLDISMHFRFSRNLANFKHWNIRFNVSRCFIYRHTRVKSQFIIITNYSFSYKYNTTKLLQLTQTLQFLHQITVPTSHYSSYITLQFQQHITAPTLHYSSYITLQLLHHITAPTLHYSSNSTLQLLHCITVPTSHYSSYIT